GGRKVWLQGNLKEAYIWNYKYCSDDGGCEQTKQRCNCVDPWGYADWLHTIARAGISGGPRTAAPTSVFSFCLRVTGHHIRPPSILFLGCQAGAATEGRPYRAIHCYGCRQHHHDRLFRSYSTRAASG